MSGRSRKSSWKLSYLDRITLVALVRCLPHVSYKRIGEAFGMDHSSVIYHARKAGVPVRWDLPRVRLGRNDLAEASVRLAEGCLQREVASDLGVCPRTLRSALRRMQERKGPA